MSLFVCLGRQCKCNKKLKHGTIYTVLFLGSYFFDDFFGFYRDRWCYVNPFCCRRSYIAIVRRSWNCARVFRLKKKHKMKEIELNVKEKTEISVQQKKQVEKELVGILKPHSGHSVFEINLETLAIKKAEFTSYTFVIGQNHKNKELVVKEGYGYVCALNEKNALKKYLKGDSGSRSAQNPLKLNKYGL